MNVILPIGSVVKLRNTAEPVMIFGYLQKTAAKPELVVDYVAVPYPVGNVNIFTQYGFQMTDITEVVFEGRKPENYNLVCTKC